MVKTNIFEKQGIVNAEGLETVIREGLTILILIELLLNLVLRNGG